MPNEWARGTFTADNVTNDENDVLDAIEDFLLDSAVGWEKASWSDSLYGTQDRHYLRTDRVTRERWQYDGDGPTQFSGIRVFYDDDPATTTGRSGFTGQEHIVIQSFLQNVGETDRQVLTPDFVELSGSGSSQSERFGTIRIRYDNTAPNNWLLIGGEDGLYCEVGRDSAEVNLGHGAIMTFGAIPDLQDPYESSVKWTAQGLVVDLYDGCRFSENRNKRFVSNDGSNKNFTAGLQPYTPRGTRRLNTPEQYDQEPYYIGAQDSFWGATRTGRSNTSNNAIGANQDLDLAFGATFGLAESPVNERYVISPLVMLQSIVEIPIGVETTSASDVAASTNDGAFLNPRSWRRVFKFAACDYTLLPFANITDAISGATYRVARVDDNGRFSQLGVEFPATTVTISI